MKKRLTRTWKLVASFTFLDIGHGFYMTKFDNEEDNKKVIKEGPRLIFYHYVTEQAWSPSLFSSEAKINKTFMWVRFPSLNLIVYDESILLAMAATIGTPIKVDSNKLNVRR